MYVISRLESHFPNPESRKGYTKQSTRQARNGRSSLLDNNFGQSWDYSFVAQNRDLNWEHSLEDKVGKSPVKFGKESVGKETPKKFKF